MYTIYIYPPWQVQINFLPVGHTHEDIDQLFSKIGNEIRRTGCESIPGIIGSLLVCIFDLHQSFCRFASANTPLQFTKSQFSPPFLCVGL